MRYAVSSLIVFVLMSADRVTLAQDRPHTGTLVVTGDSGQTVTLKAGDLASMPRTSITVKQPDGRGVTHDGVLVGDLLKKVGAPLGKALRGEAMTTYVVASATDGYRVVFSLAELDPEFTSSRIMVVDRTNGQPLLADQGPFRIVAPNDLPGARSMRMLERIEVVRLLK